ncbi:MAG: GNAT family N-acetyltransferase [Acholeplasmataceae bacterium]|jgi:GNAT superfamily N-acetyltransferase
MENYDLLVDLYDVKLIPNPNLDIRFVKVLAPDADKVVTYVKDNFRDEWASEIKAALYKSNPSCFIAIKDEKIIGFACYDATAKGFFGPIGVSEEARGLGVGTTLVQMTLLSMLEDGYAYAIIGGPSVKVHDFYRKACSKVLVIPDSRKIYLRMIRKINR